MSRRVLPISLPEYRSFLNCLWDGSIKRLGLAVSGGVDSMALAYLTHKFLDEERRLYGTKNTLQIHAFVIDHGVRPGSLAEAAAVADILKGYGFSTNVLPLLWEPGELSAGGFETRARAARYRTLAKACVQNKVFKLLLAHHADDQAETVMMRLISGSRFDGLAGMKAVAGIPECHGLYGAKGVDVWRPLLAIGKEQLIATCEQNNVEWFEDYTNHDATYTRRNAIRQLLSASPPRLPKALQQDSLVCISRRAEIRNHTVKEAAFRLRVHCKVSLSARTGTLHFSLPPNHLSLWGDATDSVRMRLLIDIAEIASPSPRVETRQMLTVFRRVFSAGEVDQIPTFTSGGLMWTYRGQQEWTLDREPLMAQRKEQVTELVVVEHDWSEWKLWDGRWWIRVQTPAWVKRCYVRVLQDKDMGVLRAMAVKRGIKGRLSEVLKELKMGIRFTVPVVFWKGKGEEAEAEVELEAGEVLVSLPTVGLNFVDGVRYQVRFKG